MHGIQHIQEPFTGDVALESFHGLRSRFDALILPFYGIVVVPETMLPAGYWYTMNHSDTCVIEVFVEG